MIKLTKILFPSDFGESAEEALRYASMLASEYGAELTIMHVVSLFGEGPGLTERQISEMQHYAEQFSQQLHDEAEEIIDKTIEDHREGDLVMKKLVVRGISAHQLIIQVAAEQEFDLVVMGTYGRGGVSHMLFGSTAEQVVRLAPCPVLTVRHHADRVFDFQRIRKILFPTDFSDYSKKALPYALSFAERYGSELHVLHVFEQRIHPAFYIVDKSTPFDLDEGLRDRALDALDEFVYEDLREKINFRCEVTSGKPFVEIINYAKANEIDLIVTATHGLTGLEYMVIGSTTERVVRKSPCPVLSIKDPEHEFVQL
ncbi:MAG TPA: universal stress protein [Candidatus Glassbacteria bacterium]|nr:universal stress protein [Candidatus Glassbacteria bacterium]